MCTTSVGEMSFSMFQRTLSATFYASHRHIRFQRRQLTGQLVQRCHFSASTKPVTAQDEHLIAKPFSSIPGPKGLPFVGSIFDLPIFGKEKEVDGKLSAGFARYGPIYKIKIGSLSIVNISDVDEVEKLCRQEGKYPRRIIVQNWRDWRDSQGLSRGVLTEDGPDWKRMRTILDKQMLRPQHVATYTNNFNEVVTDLIERLNLIRKTKGNGLTVPNIDHELFHWSLETIGTVLYETRFGGLSDKRLPETTQFIQAVQDVFTTTEFLAYLPVKLNRIFFRKLQKLEENSWEIIFKTTERLIENKFREIQKKLENGEETSGFLAYLLSTNMSKSEVFGNIAEIMLGAVDTTSNTMQWILYEVSRKPELQEKLHAEVTAIAPVGSFPTYETLQQMPLLKATVKEVLRLYPVAHVVARVLNEDMVISGYHLPADTTVMGSTFLLGRNPDLFKDPLEFKPERWLRKDSSETIHNFAWLPFGFGPRSCIGRRVAELEMHLLLARISQLFILKPGDSEPLNPTIRSLLVPERPVNVQFIDRKH